VSGVNIEGEMIMANITPGETDKHKKIIVRIKEKAEAEHASSDAPDVVLLTIGNINGKRALFNSPSTRTEAKYLVTELNKLKTLPFDEDQLLEPVGIIYIVKKNNILETGEKLE